MADTNALDLAVQQWAADGIDMVRLGYADLIGVERGRDVLRSQFARVAGHGVAFCQSVYATTPHGGVVDFAGGLSAGLPDVVAVPDLHTAQPIPWEPGVTHVIADLRTPDGAPSPQSPRQVLRRVLAEYESLGLRPIVGPELEFFLLDREESAANGWTRYGHGRGNVYTAGRRGDPDNVLLDMLRQLGGFGLDVTAGNHEFSEGQFEINLWHGEPLNAADRAHRFKLGVSELARRDGRLATFMAKPFNDEGGSGFHLHFSALDAQGRSVFEDAGAPDGLSPTARHAIAGILHHAPALSALTNPTVNSYKRFGPDSLAPWLIDWGLDNRSAMLRVPPERGAATRVEVRLGDASANAYLLIAAILSAALLGIRQELQPPEPLTGYGYDASKAPTLPGSLPAALDAFAADAPLRALLGEPFVATFLAYKRDEVARHARWVSDWEFAEYAGHN